MLDALVDDIIATLKPGFRHEPWQIEVSIAPGIACDSYPGPLGQVISNLIQNAVLHAFAGRPQGRLTISGGASDPDTIRLAFADDGNGMEEAVLQRIFDPFFTTRIGKGGSGLGLSISHNLATGVLGGSLSATSTACRGSCFVLTFPRVAGGG